MRSRLQKQRQRARRTEWLAVLTLLAAGCTADTSVNNAPVAKAGEDQAVDAGAAVTLDGSASSDPEGDVLTFSWRQTAGTEVTLSAPTAAQPTFTAPAEGTLLMFELTVSDGNSQAVDTVNVTVRAVDALATVMETRQRPIGDDPAVTGAFPAGWTFTFLPDGPQESPDEGAPEGIDDIVTAPPTETDVAPGATQEVAAQIAGASVLIGTAKWSGTTAGLEVRLVLDGNTLIAGETYTLGDDRGGSNLKIRTTGGGRAALTLKNTSDVTVHVRMILGTVAL